MEPITSNDFLNSVLETEAWKEVSQSGSLSMTMIEKFADKLDWEEVSGNRNIIWTVEGINKFANKIHWDEFSRSCPENLLCSRCAGGVSSPERRGIRSVRWSASKNY